jgi:hypothetical protein
MDASFGACACGHPIYEHGRVNKDGNQVWSACRILDCGCLTFRASDGSLWPEIHKGATLDDPDDLDRNTDAWVDGRVMLEHERATVDAAPPDLAETMARARRAQGGKR